MCVIIFVITIVKFNLINPIMGLHILIKHSLHVCDNFYHEFRLINLYTCVINLWIR